MDASKLRSLPPSKRFVAMHRNRDKENEDPSSLQHQLPTKKRKESRQFDALLPPVIATTYCLPTKKRVSAFRPDFEFPPLSPIDLNVDYKPPILSPPLPFEDHVETRPAPKTLHEKDEDPVNGCKESSASVIIGGEAHEVLPQESEITEEICPQGDDAEITEGVDVNNAEDEDEDDGILCAICQSTDGDPEDPIVFCDGCDLMVHTSCYGSPLTRGIPEGDWFCNQCLAAPKARNTDSFKCCLCPNNGGAMKSTADGRWVHVVCALFVPEVFFHDSEGRDGIDFSEVPARRWDRRCYICEGKRGCAIDCSEPKCPLSFHVTCGLNKDLSIEYREGKVKGTGAIVAGFCKKHTQLWEKQQRTGKFKIVARHDQQ